MNNRQTLLTAIKESTLKKHLISLSHQPHPKCINRTPFEIYQYEESVDYTEVEYAMKEQIIEKLNRYLIEQEQARLKMQLFGLEEAIEIQENEIAMLRLQIDTEMSNNKTSQILRIAQMQRKNEDAQIIVHKEEPQELQLKSKENLKENNQLAIFPCVRVDLNPPKKSLPLLALPNREERQIHPKSHRQLLATYTKRSLASSQEHPHLHKDYPNQEDHDKTIKPHPQNHTQASLKGIQRQISFLERAWEKAKAQGKGKLCRQYKKGLMNLIGQFWQATH